MLSTAVEMLGVAMLSAAAWLEAGLPAALLIAGVALVLKANLEIGKPRRRTRLVRVSGPLTNGELDHDVAPLTNGALEREQA